MTVQQLKDKIDEAVTMTDLNLLREETVKSLEFDSSLLSYWQMKFWILTSLKDRLRLMTIARDNLQKKLSQAEQDALIMALRLLGEDKETFSPETQEVMSRWAIKALAVFENPDSEYIALIKEKNIDTAYQDGYKDGEAETEERLKEK